MVPCIVLYTRFIHVHETFKKFAIN
jgi:hypothetical protein